MLPYHIPWARVAAHLGYVNAFVGMPWLQMSYWSLAIEFQYYIFVGLCFPLVALKQRLSPAFLLGLLGGGQPLGRQERGFAATLFAVICHRNSGVPL